MLLDVDLQAVKARYAWYRSTCGCAFHLGHRQLWSTVINPSHGWDLEPNGPAWRVLGVLNFQFLSGLVSAMLHQAPALELAQPVRLPYWHPTYVHPELKL